MTYGDRSPTDNSDGSPLFASNLDRANETEAKAAIEAAWRCELRYFGRLAPVDFYAVRDGRIVGVLELKSRTHESGRFSTVFLNVRKWLALMLAQAGLGAPAIFVVKFMDGIRFVRIDDVDASRVKIGGTSKIVKSHSDIEPVIEVPIAQMRPLVPGEK